MTEVDLCPEISVLSAFLDEELADEENARARVHLRNCPACAGRLKRMEEGDRLLVRSLAKSMTRSENPRKEDCITSEAMASYLHDLLSVEEKARVEGHLDHCDACLGELASLAKTETRLSQSRMEPLPDSLRERVEAFWKEGERAKERILRVAIRLARQGIEIARDSLFPQAVSVQEVFAPAGAYRDAGPKGSVPSGVLVKKELSGGQLSLLIGWEKENRANLKIKLEDEKSNPLEGKRVLLRREKVLLHSERTGAEGAVVIGNLEPGAYQLGILILEKEFYVDLEINQG